MVDTSRTGATPICIGVVQGDGRSGMKVAGTSYHQSEIEALAGGRTSELAHVKCAALLLPEPTNPYDPNAVAVFIVTHGRKTGIGYLQHDIAPLFNRCLLENGYSAGACNAVIVGGWHNKNGDDGYFGVRLDACLPFQLQALALPDPNSPCTNRIATRSDSRASSSGDGFDRFCSIYFCNAWGSDVREFSRLINIAWIRNTADCSAGAFEHKYSNCQI